MQIQINGEARDFPEGLNAQQLVERLGFAGQRVAIELNGEVLPRSRWQETKLRAGDTAELVRAIGGG